MPIISESQEYRNSREGNMKIAFDKASSYQKLRFDDFNLANFKLSISYSQTSFISDYLVPNHME